MFSLGEPKGGVEMESYYKVLEFYDNHKEEIRKKGGTPLRFGQFFVNKFISKPWPELFYSEEPAKTREMIISWLTDHHYYNDLPPLRLNTK